MVDPVTTATIRVATEGEESLDRLNDAFDKLGESAGAAAKTIGSIDTAGAAAVASAVSDSQGAAKAASTGIVAAVRGFFSDFTSGAQSAAESATTSLQGFASKLFGGFAGKAGEGGFGAAFGEIWGSISEGLSRLGGPIGDIIGKVASMGGEFISLGTRVAGLTGEFGAAGAAIGVFAGGLVALAAQLNLMGKVIGYSDKAAEGMIATYANMSRYGGTYAEAQERIKVGFELFGDRYETMQARLTKLFSEKNIEGGAKGGGAMVEHFERLGITYDEVAKRDPTGWLLRFAEIRDAQIAKIAALPVDTPQRVQAENKLDQIFSSLEFIGGRIFGPDFQRMIQSITPEQITRLGERVRERQEAWGEILTPGADRQAADQRRDTAYSYQEAMFAMSDAWGKMFAAIGGKVMPTLTEAFNTITEKLLQIGPAFSQLASVLATKGWEVLTQAMAQVDLTKWSELFKDIAGFGTEFKPEEAGKGLAQFISDLPDSLRSAAAAVNDFVAALGGIQQALGWLIDPQKRLREEADKMVSAAQESGSWGEKFNAYATKGLSMLLDQATTATTGVPAVAGAPATAAAVVDTTATTMGESVAQIGTSFTTGAAELGGQISSGASELGSQITSGAASLGATITSGASELASGVTNGISAGAAAISATASGWGATAGAALRASIAGLSIPAAGGVSTGATAAAAPASTGLSEP